jgi:hypothetical protein
MKRFIRPALLAAGAAMLTACSMFQPSQQQSPTPAPSSYNDGGAHSGNYPGPGTHDPNRD